MLKNSVKPLLRIFRASRQAPEPAVLVHDRYEDLLACSIDMDARWYYERRSPLN